MHRVYPDQIPGLPDILHEIIHVCFMYFTVHQQSKLGSETLGFSRVWHKKSRLTIHFYGLDNYVALMREIITCLSLENCTYHEHIFSIQEVNGTSYQPFEKKNAGLGKVNFFIWRIKVESEMKRKCV